MIIAFDQRAIIIFQVAIRHPGFEFQEKEVNVMRANQDQGIGGVQPGPINPGDVTTSHDQK